MDGSEPKQGTEPVSTNWRQFIVRYLLLAPTVLTLLADIQQVGQIAHWLVEKWRPFLNVVGDLIEPYIPQYLIDRKTALLILFFLPFAITGIIRVIRGKKRTSIITMLFFTPSFIFIASLFIGRDYTIIAFGGILIVLLFFVEMMAHVARSFGLISKKFDRSFPIYWVFALFPVIVLILSYESWHQHTSIVVRLPTLIEVVGVCIFPLLNPRRVVDVAVIVGGILLISRAYDYVQAWVPTLNR